MDKKATILVDFDHTLFDVTKLIKFLSDSPETIDYKSFLYADSLEFIDYASKFGNLILFSEGKVEYQKEKIEATEVGKLFSGGVKIFPSYSKMQDLAKISSRGKIILIDDKPDVVDQAISMGCKVIRVKRGKYRGERTKTKPNFVVGSLAEIIAKDVLQSI